MRSFATKETTDSFVNALMLEEIESRRMGKERGLFFSVGGLTFKSSREKGTADNTLNMVTRS